MMNQTQLKPTTFATTHLVTTPFAKTPTADNELALRWGSHQLLIPHTDVFSLETPLDLSANKTQASKIDQNHTINQNHSINQNLSENPHHSGALGYIRRSDISYPIYGLSETFELLTDLPESRRLCALLQLNGKVVFGLLCDDIHFIGADTVRPVAIPSCMDIPNLAFNGLGISGSQLFYRSNTLILYNYLQELIIPKAFEF